MTDFGKSLWRAMSIAFGILVMAPPIASAACLGDSESSKRYSFAVVPQLPPKLLYQNWSPFLTSVGSAMGVCFDLRIEDNIPEFEAQLLSGRYDFAYMNPYHAYLAKDAVGFDPIIVDEARKLSGIIIVAASSDIKTVQDLEGKTIAFPAPNAFGSSLLVRAYLQSQNISYHAVYRETHSNVYRQTARGFADAGGGVNNTLLREPKELHEALRVLFTTKGFVSHPIGVSPEIDTATREALINAIFALVKTQAGKHTLDKIQIPKPRRADYANDFAVLESLNFADLSSSIGER